MLTVSRENELKQFLFNINFKTTNYELVDVALTHSSFHFENNIENGQDYERLEFLGDAVLKLIVSKILFEKYPDYKEGQMTKIRGIIISDDYLSKLANKINLNKYLNLGIHEEKSGGRTRSSILACAFEALLGALYQDGQLDNIYAFLYSLYEPHIQEIDDNMCIYNAKALLQEYTQGKNKDLPEYKIENEVGKDHNKTYEVAVYYQNKEIGRGKGKSKKEAEKQAALDASENLGLIKEGKCQ
ncbi:MAG: ribonuclease III [Candidatus Gastranaerophilales bacterium]|nr:ribonuclease III [Candidatus Gastranaerophilales bacterium]